ncbi:hypothetical protein BH09ACT7_BH09ACT7_04720 [soil metagenome]
MVGGDYLGGVNVVPAFLKHAPDVGFTVADAVAPCFIFVIGLNYGPSFARRLRLGAVGAYRHFLVRYLALVGIGAILTAGGTSVAGEPTDWGVLQSIGMAGLICLLVIRLSAAARIVVGLLMLWGYQYLLDGWTLATVLHSAQGGFFGAISWGALLILSTAVADVWRRGFRPYAICCAVLVIVAGGSAVIVPVSKNRVSASFVLITLAISALVFLLVDLASRGAAKRAGVFCWWGENPLALYLLHLLILGIVVLPRVAWWYADAPVWLVALQLTAIYTAMSAAAWWMHRRTVKVEL